MRCWGIDSRLCGKILLPRREVWYTDAKGVAAVSFCATVKEELCRVQPERPCCRAAELAAAYLTLGRLSLLGQGRVSVRFETESPAVARRIFTLLQKELGVAAQLHYVTHARFGGKRSCVLTLGPVDCPKLLCRLGMMEALPEGGYRFAGMQPKLSLTRACCQHAFIRGAFLGCGAATDPEKAYSLELVTLNEPLRQELRRCLGRLELPMREIERRDAVVLYLKQSDAVLRFLTLAGAHQAVLGVENLRVRRQMVQSVNRAVNCDTHNLQRMMAANERQIEQIARLISSERFGALSPALQEIARARLRAPDMSLQQLGESLDPPLGKSGVNHRLRRLLQIAAEDGQSDELAKAAPDTSDK